MSSVNRFLIFLVVLVSLCISAVVRADSVTGPGGLAAYYFDGSRGTLNLSNGRIWVIELTNIDGSAVTGNKAYHLLLQDHGTGSGWETLPTQNHHDFYGAGGHLLQSDDLGWVVRSSHGFNPGDVPGTFDLRVVLNQIASGSNAGKWNIRPYYRPPGGNWNLFYDGAWITNTAFNLTMTRLAVQIDAGGGGTLTFSAPTANSLDPAQMFVDDDWVGLPNGTLVYFPGDPNPHYIGFDAFATIQGGVDAVAIGGAVNVAAGLYEEQVVVAKEGVRITGAGKGTNPNIHSIIKSPVSLAYYFTTAVNNFPIVCFHDVSSGRLSGFRIDGAGRGNNNYRFVGIGFWNAGGVVSECEVTGIADTPFSGRQHGVGIYAYNNTGGPYSIEISGTDLDGYQKNAIALSGEGLTAIVSNCTVTGTGPTSVIAQNGIQIGYGAGGTIRECVASGHIYTGTGWAACGILLFSGTTVDVLSTRVVDNLTGVYYIDTDGNFIGDSLVGGAYGLDGLIVYSTSAAKGGVELRRQALPLAESDISAQGKSNMSLTVRNTVFQGDSVAGSWGVYGWGDANVLQMSVSGCIVADWDYGIVAYENGGTVNLDATGNSVSGNISYGFYTNSAAIKDGSANWWGTSDTLGVRVSVSSNIDFTPWLESGVDLSSDSVGFQGDFSWLNVDDNSPQFGTVGRVQEGINLVTTSTVKVWPGTYNEKLSIGKSLALVGDPGDTSVAGPGPSAPVLDGTGFSGVPAISLAGGVSNVVIEGFEIRNFGPNGNTNADAVVAWNSGTSNVTVRDNYLHHLGYAGVLTGNGWGGPQGLHDGWQVCRNVIEYFGAYALDLENAQNSRLAGNVISNPATPTLQGIMVVALADPGNSITSSNIAVTKNQLLNFPDRALNFVTWAQSATSSATLSGITIADNVITTNFQAISIWKLGSGTNSVRDFNITGNQINVNNPKASGYAIDLFDVAGNSVLAGNTVTLTGALQGGASFFHGINIGGGATGNWTIDSCLVDGGDLGALDVGLRVRSTLASTSALTITRSTFTRFAYGVRADVLPTGTIVDLFHCGIFGNSVYGVSNGAGMLIDAEANWWGSYCGP